jgi:hypothetical protein
MDARELVLKRSKFGAYHFVDFGGLLGRVQNWTVVLE